MKGEKARGARLVETTMKSLVNITINIFETFRCLRCQFAGDLEVAVEPRRRLHVIYLFIFYVVSFARYAGLGGSLGVSKETPRIDEKAHRTCLAHARAERLTKPSSVSQPSGLGSYGISLVFDSATRGLLSGPLRRAGLVRWFGHCLC